MVQPPMAQPPTCTCDRANRSALRRLAVYLYHARLMETNRLAPVSRQAARAARGLGHNCGARRCSLQSTLARAAHNLQRGGRAIGKAAWGLARDLSYWRWTTMEERRKAHRLRCALFLRQRAHTRSGLSWRVAGNAWL